MNPFSAALTEQRQRALVARMGGLLNRCDSRNPVGVHGSDPRVVLVAPTEHGSMGDEAMAHATGQYLSRHQWSMRLMAPGGTGAWFSDEDQALPLSLTALEDWSRMRVDRRSPDLGAALAPTCAVIGADSIDGAYGSRVDSLLISYLNAAAQAGSRACLVNFSLRQTRTRAIEWLLRSLDPRVELFARDLDSRQRAEDLWQREVGAFPDVALYLEPSVPPDASPRPPDVTRPQVILVVNGHFSKLHLEGDAGVQAYFAELGKQLREIGDVVVMAHDIRDRPGDPSLVRRICEELPGTRAVVPSTARDAKAILATGDIVVTARMHAAVASLSSGVPTVGLDYVDKFKGQFAWYGQEENVMPSTPDAVGEVVELAGEVLATADLIRHQLAAANAQLTRAAIPWLPSDDC